MFRMYLLLTGLGLLIVPPFVYIFGNSDLTLGKMMLMMIIGSIITKFAAKSLEKYSV